MIVSYKDTFKMFSIIIVSFCAVFVCTLFLNYYMDLAGIEQLITTDISRLFYEAQCNTSKVVSGVSGGCLLLTTVVLVCFYIGHFIDTHMQQLGILKALGYSQAAIARRFTIFGFPVFIGCAAGFLCAHLLMPRFYETQNQDGYLPHLDIGFHPFLFAALVILPAIFFALLAIFYSVRRLKLSALELIKSAPVFNHSNKKANQKKSTLNNNLSFLAELRKSNLRQRKSLVFFITFAAFCFSSMTQMSFSMDSLSSRMMAVMIMCIGIILAAVTLLIATTSVIKANGKTITMMKVFGYKSSDCSMAVLGGYRPWAYFGFILGSVYQYVLLKIMLTIVFADIEPLPDYSFDWSNMFASLAAFILIYEAVMLIYTKKMTKLSVKEIMSD